MATYVISDIHGQYDMFIDLLGIIDLKETDSLYILGDVLDRGPHPIQTMLKLMEMPNVTCIVGNHELMALECLGFLMQEITEEALKSCDETMIENLFTWQINGSDTTIKEFQKLSRNLQRAVLDYIREFEVYEELSVSGRDFLLVHAGLGDYWSGKAMEEYSLDELVWTRAEYDIRYFEDKYVVTGHTPTQGIPGNPRPGYIFKQNNHIAIDCGCNRRDGRLGAICLDTLDEFYAER